MKNIFRTIFIFVLFFSAKEMLAAEFVVYKELPKTNDIKVGDEVLVSIGFVAEGVNYNAFEGRLSVGENFEIVKTVTGNSFVTVWLEDPAKFSLREIEFSGITPVGYNKEEGILFSVVLRAVSSGAGRISLEETSVYRNDGSGTQDYLSASSLQIFTRAMSSNEEPYLIAVKDVTPPEEFKIELVRDPNLFDGSYTLIWNTLDKGSGVASYDLSLGLSIFKQVESPYVLEKDRPRGKIKVIAYDYEGNTREAVLVPPGTVCIPGVCFGLVHGVVAVAVIIGLILIWRKRKK